MNVACYALVNVNGVPPDPHHSKLGDTRPRLFETMVRFGDSPQVNWHTHS